MKNNILVENNIYHICNKSISHFNIFSGSYFADRFLTIVEYYNSIKNRIAYSQLEKYQRTFTPIGLLTRNDNQIVRILAFCIMPDHYHLLIKPLISNNKEICHYIGTIENSFSRYFNMNRGRKGPLWQSRFRSIRIRSNEQLLHVTRYIHLNPVTGELVVMPEDWPYSSYLDYLKQEVLDSLTEISISKTTTYRKFVENNKDYQKTLILIKSRLLE